MCTSSWPTITSFSTGHIFSSSFPYRNWAILNIVSCGIDTCYKMTPAPPCLSTLWFVPALETKVVWQEGPFLVCHSTLIQYLVAHNCKPKKSLQNFTSFVQCCGNNITMLQPTTNLQTWKNSKALNLLWSITTTQLLRVIKLQSAWGLDHVPKIQEVGQRLQTQP